VRKRKQTKRQIQIQKEAKKWSLTKGHMYRQNCNGTETKSIDCSNKMTDRKSWKNREKKTL